MNIQEAIKLRILNLCHSKNITLNRLATLSGMPQSTISSLIDGSSQNPKILTIVRICFGFKITLHEFFNDKIFLDVDDE